MENRFSRFHSAGLSCLLSTTMVIRILFHFKTKVSQENNFTLLVRSIIFNAIKLLFKQSFFVKHLTVKYLHVNAF